MSAVKRAGRKIYRNTVGRIPSSIRKPLLIVGGTLLTAGLASGGFAAFKAASGPLGVFQATGQTMAAGAQAIAGSLGFGSGVTGTVFANAGAGGATLGTGALAQTLGLAGPLIGPAAPAGVATTAGQGFLGVVGKSLSGLGGSTVGQMMLAQGVMGGIQSFAAGREARRQEKRHDQGTVWGAQRRGGGGENHMGDIELPRFADNTNMPPTVDQWRAAQPQYNQAQEERMAFRRPLIDRPSDVPGMLDPEDDFMLPMQGIMYG